MNCLENNGFDDYNCQRKYHYKKKGKVRKQPSYTLPVSVGLRGLPLCINLLISLKGEKLEWRNCHDMVIKEFDRIKLKEKAGKLPLISKQKKNRYNLLLDFPHYP